MAETLSGIGVLTYFPFDSLNAVTMTCRATSTGRAEVVVIPFTGDGMDRFTIPRENVILWEPCECPNCDDPHNGSECMRNFCSVCRDELGWDATWPEQCDDCRGGWVIEELPVNGGR